MTTVPRIESHNLSVAELFRDFYSVPDFQREYVWKKDNVEKLLLDVIEELYDDDEPVINAEYFLGSIVVFRDESGTFQLIDGQQRLTTIYMTFCAIRDLLHESEQQSRSIEGLISGVAQDLKTGLDIPRFRVTLQYGAGDKALSIIASKEEKISDIDKGVLSSVQHLIDAYEVLKELILERLKPEKILQFSTIFSNRVKLIRIETPSFKNALKVFETINDRGIGLNSMDLLKNYLFINTASSNSSDNVKSHWQSLKGRWDKLTKILYKCDEDPMRFLRYYIMSHYEVDLQNNFPEEDIYDWFVKDEQHQISKSPLVFVDKLIEAAEHHSHFVKGENIDGSPNPYLKNIKKLQGRYRQHFILLLAGRYLSQDIFVKLSYWVENLLFINTITRSTRKDINVIRTFSQWSKSLRAIKGTSDFDSFIKNYLYKEISSLSSDFDLTFRELTDSKIAKFRIKYILAKMTQFVNEQAYSTPIQLDEYLDKSLTIEHILPKSPNAKLEMRKKFDKSVEYDLYASKLGNLLLLEKPINSSISDSIFEKKKDGYSQSQFLLVRSLVENSKVGNNTQINRAVKSLNLKHFDNWNSSAIDERQEIMVSLARKVWGLDYV
jgi:uncharacterized protein with ParB-like and HNH nuclease domain